MERLPVGCVSAILSETSPEDVFRLSAVSTTFYSASEWEFIWEKFLPSEYRDVVSRSAEPLKPSTKKELFLRLCDPLLMDQGRKSFKLEKSTGRVSYVLSARELSITWSSDPIYWAWKSMPESRFQEVVELKTGNWIEIEGKIRTGDLSPNTPYGAYLIMKVMSRAYGLDLMPSETSIGIGNRVACAHLAWLQSPSCQKQEMECQIYGHGVEMLRKEVEEGEVRVPSERGDGWMEIELGQFFTGGPEESTKEVKMSLKEVKGYQLKGGLVIEGIEIRPI
ncbi:hypothetical protein CRG98_032283 [Punica granatum]|nr:hypothetical protein CRG98_032283 [Punica granatum]